MLGLTAMLIRAPVMFGVRAFITNRDRMVEADDLKSRECRDEAGRTHHHTRTFLRDHAGELGALAS